MASGGPLGKFVRDRTLFAIEIMIFFCMGKPSPFMAELFRLVNDYQCLSFTQFNGIEPLVMTKILNRAIEIVSFPMNNCDFPLLC